MDETLKRQILDKISKSQSILIAVSEISGFDGLAAGLAFYLSVNKLGKSVLISAKEPSAGDARSLYAVDKISKAQTIKNLVINVDNAINNVDKVTYSLEGDRLKIIVHSLLGSDSVSPSDVSFEGAFTSQEVIIAIGFDSLDLLKKEVTHGQNISSDTFLINLSLVDPSQKYAQIEFVDPNSSGLCEIVASMLKDLRLPIDEDISFNLYSGIKWSTNMFAPKFVKPSTLNTAQYLIDFGAGKSTLAQSAERLVGDDIKRLTLSSPQGFSGRDLRITPDMRSKNVSDLIPQKAKLSNKSELTGTQLYNDQVETGRDMVKAQQKAEESWLKPPKVYRGSKSFDRES